MKYGIINTPIATIYGAPALTWEKEKGLCSAITDEALYGMGVMITREAENGFYPVLTHYGYTGYVQENDLRLVSPEELIAWESSRLMVVSGICVDITSLPDVEGVVLVSLFRGALVQVLEFDSAEKTGWARVMLVDGRTGFMRNQYLMEKRFSQAGLWQNLTLPDPGNFSQQAASDASRLPSDASQLPSDASRLPSDVVHHPEALPQAVITDEEAFREAVTRTARTYLGVQYRWGGKSPAGIDCSGLTSMSYMLNGILTFRDAKIVEGFPVHEIPVSEIKKGDLLYFPGHIAMYLGDGRYIHSTGKLGSGGVVINSLRPQDPDYREDLVKCLYAAGSIF